MNSDAGTCVRVVGLVLDICTDRQGRCIYANKSGDKRKLAILLYIYIYVYSVGRFGVYEVYLKGYGRSVRR